VALLAHPRRRARAEEFGVELATGAIRPGSPLPYAQMVAAVSGSAGVVTDSGGLQKEAYLLGRPCTTVRTETEWPETLADGWNVLAEVGDPAFARAATRPASATPPGAPFGDGRAAERVVKELERAAR
jgi:UDP-N-acetylglucosamine 2-epimerase (non-hydrolysing)